MGAHPSGRIGEDPGGIPNNLMPYIAQVAVGKLRELAVFGGDYPTPDGTGVRDYIHVVDLALGHLRALERLADRPGMLTLNLGTGRGYSVLDMVRAFERPAAGRCPTASLTAGPVTLPGATPTLPWPNGNSAGRRPATWEMRGQLALAECQPPGLRSTRLSTEKATALPLPPLHRP